MLELLNESLHFSFPEVHPDAGFQVGLIRTLRIPDDDKEYPLPPGLGQFPLRHVEDFKGKVPARWSKRGGLLLPMYQSEAMWLQFAAHYPVAVKVAAGKVSALTGKKWRKGLRKKDYMLGHRQPWLDGYVVEDGTIRQFVAEPLGMGLTAEGQITGKEEFGGVQIEVFPLKRSIYEEKFRKQRSRRRVLRGGGGMSYGAGGGGCSFPGQGGVPGIYTSLSTSKGGTSVLTPQSLGGAEYTSSVNMVGAPVPCAAAPDPVAESVQDMGLAAGGRMRQQVFEDQEFNVSDWDVENGSRVFVHLVNSMVWQQVTGGAPPQPPMTAAQYAAHGYPWFDHWDAELRALKGTGKTSSLKSVAQLEKEKGVKVLPDNPPLPTISKLVPQKHAVTDGDW